MLKDLEEMAYLKDQWGMRVSYFSRVYPPFDPEIKINVADLDTSSQVKYWTLFGLSKPFRSNSSSFDALIAEGQSSLLTNKTLFSNIQQFYTFNTPANEDLFQTLRGQQSDLSVKYAQVITYQPYKKLSDITDRQLIADLNIYFESLSFYYRTSFIRNPAILEEIISEIDEELKK
jgi:hypothetical protein